MLSVQYVDLYNRVYRFQMLTHIMGHFIVGCDLVLSKHYPDKAEMQVQDFRFVTQSNPAKVIYCLLYKIFLHNVKKHSVRIRNALI